ncbi:hypothetical protein CDAR_537671 [Caerostris darwini]|uniref:Uncharacterized protein n=1 Tax=Caerostris darwini TaxID=1538125 RepID=A0AAV4MGN2_9ARAC|nr:hypothetical protein CDAR_537671 [Caerostris darwini]
MYSACMGEAESTSFFKKRYLVGGIPGVLQCSSQSDLSGAVEDDNHVSAGVRKWFFGMKLPLTVSNKINKRKRSAKICLPSEQAIKLHIAPYL